MSGDTSPAVSLERVTCTFGEATAVDDLTCAVPRGGVLGLVGHRGSGRTTVLRLIDGVLRPTSGQVRVLGMNPATHGPQVRRHVGVLLPDPGVDLRLTGRQNLLFAASLHGIERDVAAERIDDLAVSFHLDDRLDEPAGRYSAGMRQRLALARTLLPRPSVVLLDEPTAELDAMAAHGVRQLIRDLAGSPERTVILATSELMEAVDLCDRIAVLQRGRLVAFDDAATLAGQVTPHGLRVTAAESDLSSVMDLASELGYTVEPLGPGQVTVHGARHDDVPGFVRALVDAGVALYGVTVDPPTLTDLYLGLHQDHVEATDAG